MAEAFAHVAVDQIHKLLEIYLREVSNTEQRLEQA